MLETVNITLKVLPVGLWMGVRVYLRAVSVIRRGEIVIWVQIDGWFTAVNFLKISKINTKQHKTIQIKFLKIQLGHICLLKHVGM